MPATPLPADLREMLAKPNPAVITSSGPTASRSRWPPGTSSTGTGSWSTWTRAASGWSTCETDPRVSLTALDEESWYTHVSVQGRVVEMADDPDLTDIDRLSRHYRGQDYPQRDRGRVSAWIEVDSWHGWGKAARAPEESGNCRSPVLHWSWVRSDAFDKGSPGAVG